MEPTLGLPGIVRYRVSTFDDDADRTMLLCGKGTDSADGRIALNETWKKNTKREMDALNVLEIDFDFRKVVPLFKKMRKSMVDIARFVGETGSDSFFTPLWDPSDIDGSMSIVFHNLGGCCMGKNRELGVVNSYGQVYKANGNLLTETYENLYIADGSIVPTSLGVNPSLTISALAFRIAEYIIGSSQYLPVDEVNLGTEKIYFFKSSNVGIKSNL